MIRSDLALKLCHLIENNTIRLEMGCLAKRNVKRFRADTIVKEWDELFKSIMK